MKGLLFSLHYNSVWIQHKHICFDPLGSHPQWVAVRDHWLWYLNYLNNNKECQFRDVVIIIAVNYACTTGATNLPPCFEEHVQLMAWALRVCKCQSWPNDIKGCINMLGGWIIK